MSGWTNRVVWVDRTSTWVNEKISKKRILILIIDEIQVLTKKSKDGKAKAIYFNKENYTILWQ